MLDCKLLEKCKIMQQNIMKLHGNSKCFTWNKPVLVVFKIEFSLSSWVFLDSFALFWPPPSPLSFSSFFTFIIRSPFIFIILPNTTLVELLTVMSPNRGGGTIFRIFSTDSRSLHEDNFEISLYCVSSSSVCERLSELFKHTYIIFQGFSPLGLFIYK